MTYVDFTEKTARFLYHNTTNLSTFTSVPKTLPHNPLKATALQNKPQIAFWGYLEYPTLILGP